MNHETLVDIIKRLPDSSPYKLRLKSIYELVKDDYSESTENKLNILFGKYLVMSISTMGFEDALLEVEYSINEQRGR